MEYDFSQPYRTELWLKEIQNHQLKSPICIPSYHRPNAPVFSKKSKLRNTPEELNAYSYLKDHVTLIHLPDDVEEIGMTRNFIVTWAQDHGYENIFMFDDRILDFKTLAPRLTRNNKLIMGELKTSDTLSTLKLWEYLQNLYPTTSSGVVSKGLCWNPKHINREFTVNKPGCAWEYCLINVQDLKKYDLNYQDVRQVGAEDCYIMFQILKTGLPSRIFTDIAYTEIYPEQTHKQNPNSGGHNIQGITREERLIMLQKTFIENVVGCKWNDKIPELTFLRYKDGSSGFYFNFARYWAKYYENRKVK